MYHIQKDLRHLYVKSYEVAPQSYVYMKGSGRLVNLDMNKWTIKGIQFKQYLEIVFS